MIKFEKQQWFNKTDTEKRIPISAANLNRMEEGIDATVRHVNDMTNHWWRKSKVVDAYLEFTNSSEIYFYLWNTKSETSTILYSDSVTLKIDASTGKIHAELVEPSELTIGFSNVENSKYQSALSNKYIIFNNDTREFLDNNENYGTLYQCKDNMYDVSRNSPSPIYGFKISTYKPLLNAIYGDIEYVSSPNPDTYTNGWNDIEATMYEYLGVPFENSRETVGMVTGWYYGDGTSLKTIRTIKKPKCVMVYVDAGEATYIVDYAPYLYGLATETYSMGSVSIVDNGFSVTRASPSLNKKAYKYFYIVFY